MNIKKYIRKIHLYLGLTTGLVVFVVAITGCVYCFQEEINYLFDDYKYVESQEASVIPPSEVQNIAEKIMPDRHVHGVVYGDKNEALEVVYYEAEPEFFQKAYINPYNGELINVVDMESGFFHFILDGHMNLWMGEIGNKIVSYSTLIFLISLISGLILWWPRNKKASGKRLKFSWGNRTRWKRKNYDLHNVLGFYASSIALLIALSGLIMSFNWFADGVYTATGGEKTPMFSFPENVSDSTRSRAAAKPVDLIWKKMKSEYPDATSLEMHYPPTDDHTVYAYIKFSEGTHWNADYRYFDSRTLEEVDPGHVYGDLEEASTADMIQRMNYDIHVGSIGGIAGKIIVFLSSLIVGSLPITGTIIWWGRRKKTMEKVQSSEAERREIDAAA